VHIHKCEMKALSKRNWLLSLIPGMLLVSFAASTYAEPAVKPPAVAAAKTKAVHYIENLSSERTKKQKVLKSKEIKTEEIKTQPVVEPPPLELKGVRG